MAFTRAAEVAEHVRRHVLPGVAVSIGEATGESGIEVVIKGFKHPDDGMSRIWIIDLLGQSGMMLDMVITGLRKAGFEMRGVAPMMRGVLTQVLTRGEVAQLRALAREEQRKKEAIELQAKLQGETLQVAQNADAKIQQLEEQIAQMKQLLEDMALMPQPRGPRGADGRDGVDGKDGSIVELSEAELKDLGDVLDTEAEERQVLTWKDGKWQPLFIPRFLQSGSGGGGGGTGDGGTGGGSPLTVQIRDRNDINGEPQYVQTEVTKISFDADSGFVKDDLGQGEAFIKLNSTFNPWYVDGEETLDATGEEPVEFVAGDGMTITTDATSDPKQIIFECQGGTGGASTLDELTDVDLTTNEPAVGQLLVWNGTSWVPGGAGVNQGIPEAPLDNLPYVRLQGQWVKLSHALQLLIDGSNVTTGETDAYQAIHKDGGDFTTGDSDANLPLNVDNGAGQDGGEITS